jgi:hypothetical protein
MYPIVGFALMWLFERSLAWAVSLADGNYFKIEQGSSLPGFWFPLRN